jgi:zinc protease
MERVGEAVRGLQHEMRRLLDEPVPDAELASVRNYLNGTFVLRLESHASLANQISGIQMLGLGEDYLETYTQRVVAVTAEDLRSLAARYFNPDEYALVVAGDARMLAPQLEPMGNVTVTDPGAPT